MDEKIYWILKSVLKVVILWTWKCTGGGNKVNLELYLVGVTKQNGS